MKKLSNNEAELKKALRIKKRVFSLKNKYPLQEKTVKKEKFY